MTAATAPETHTFMISEDERAELIRLLEQSLKESRVEIHRTHTPEYRDRVIGQDAPPRPARQAPARRVGRLERLGIVARNRDEWREKTGERWPRSSLLLSPLATIPSHSRNIRPSRAKCLLTPEKYKGVS